MKLIFFILISLFPVFSQGQDVKSFKQVKDRIDVILSEGTLSICPLTDNAVRIKFLKDVDTQMPKLVFTSGVRPSGYTISDSTSRLEVRVENIVVTLDKQDGRLAFEDGSEEL